jgi:CheY-like chemotaxis protein
MSILIADANPETRHLVATILDNSGHRLLQAASGVEAVRLLDAQNAIDLLIIDIRLPDIDGYRVVDMIKQRRRRLKVIYTTDDPERAMDKLGVVHGEILLKPYPMRQLMAAVKAALPFGGGVAELLQSYALRL